MPVVLKNVTKVYPLGDAQVEALKGIDLSIEDGEFTTIAGPSGCGKSTLLNLIGCMDTPSSGSVSIDSQEISTMKDRELTRLRREKLGFVFQSFNLIPVLTCEQNVEFPLLLKGGMSGEDRRRRVQELLEKVGLLPQAKQRANALSGGQRQRVAIARALVTKPRIVLADEPTANLDSENGERIISLMREINQNEKTTFIFSSHDPSIISLARRVIRLKDGLVAPSSSLS
ncbi:MAG: ABC transporter ATP-binding protein [Oligoflexales bacterium]|nr:ABC transporter ATP-binding protein [Oligoflexales bacterium]